MEKIITREDILKASNDMNAAIIRWSETSPFGPESAKARAKMDHLISIYNLTVKIYEKQQHIHAGATV